MGFKGSAYTHWSRAFPIQKLLLGKEFWCPKHEAEPLWESLENNNRLSYFLKAVDIPRPFDFPLPMKPGMPFFTVCFSGKLFLMNIFYIPNRSLQFIASELKNIRNRRRQGVSGTELCFSNPLASLLSVSTNAKSSHHFWIPECDFWLFMCCMITNLPFPLLPDEWETCFPMSALPSPRSGSAQP